MKEEQQGLLLGLPYYLFKIPVSIMNLLDQYPSLCLSLEAAGQEISLSELTGTFSVSRLDGYF